MTMPLDLDFVRSQFPAFSAGPSLGQAFFENAGGSYPCLPVIDRMHRFYLERKLQTHDQLSLYTQAQPAHGCGGARRTTTQLRAGAPARAVFSSWV